MPTTPNASVPPAVQSRRLRPPPRLAVSATEASLLKQFQLQLSTWGWSFHWSTATAAATGGVGGGVGGAGGNEEGVDYLHSWSEVAWLECAPVVQSVLLAERAALEYVHALQRTGGGSSQPPPAVLRVLASKACRRAVMFGNVLTLPQSQAILDQLATCDLPFQCAHGRPTIAPLLRLDHDVPSPPLTAVASQGSRGEVRGSPLLPQLHTLDALAERGARHHIRVK